jgi:membrane-bound lytic murein transglycosylase C
MKWHNLLIISAVILLITGCQTLDQTLKKTDRALSIVSSPTAKSLSDIASSGDAEKALENAAERRVKTYQNDPRALIADVRQAKRDFDKLMKLLKINVTKNWGGKEIKIPTRTRYVKYTQNYKSRAIVDFDGGEVTVETVDDQQVKEGLRSAIITTLLTPDDPRSVDLFSDKEIRLSGDEEPYLYNLVVDHRGRPVSNPAEAESFADYLLSGDRVKKRSVTMEKGRKDVSYVKIRMVSNFQDRKAEKYRSVVARYAEQYNISQSLVFAIIRTESNFNPFAVSPVPAYGLMQLVPASGGRDAYRLVKGVDGIPSRDYLFDAGNNIELGTAYLNVLYYSHLKSVDNSVSREYCVISAYNTGAGNVLKTFDSNRENAIDKVNRMQPPAVYEKLKTGLPHKETRNYIQKVVEYRKNFVVGKTN